MDYRLSEIATYKNIYQDISSSKFILIPSETSTPFKNIFRV